MINILRQKNDRIIKRLSLVGDSQSLKKQVLIKKLLSDDKCFFKMSMEDSLTLLLNLDCSKEEAFELYKQLSSSSEFIKNK